MVPHTSASVSPQETESAYYYSTSFMDGEAEAQRSYLPNVTLLIKADLEFIPR